MEEDIEILENLKMDTLEACKCSLSGSSDIEVWKKEAQAISNLITRVKELEESEQYLYDAYQDAGKKMFEYSEKLEKLETKIREKIEELETKRKEYEEKSEGLQINDFWHREFLKVCHKIQVLQEILEDK